MTIGTAPSAIFLSGLPEPASGRVSSTVMRSPRIRTFVMAGTIRPRLIIDGSAPALRWSASAQRAEGHTGTTF